MFVWLLFGFGSDSETPWIEGVYIDKVLAEKHLRHLRETDDGRGYIYWIKEKTVVEEQ